VGRYALTPVPDARGPFAPLTSPSSARWYRLVVVFQQQPRPEQRLGGPGPERKARAEAVMVEAEALRAREARALV
jgi:hypothetical protein